MSALQRACIHSIQAIFCCVAWAMRCAPRAVPQPYARHTVATSRCCLPSSMAQRVPAKIYFATGNKKKLEEVRQFMDNGRAL